MRALQYHAYGADGLMSASKPPEPHGPGRRAARGDPTIDAAVASYSLGARSEPHVRPRVRGGSQHGLGAVATAMNVTLDGLSAHVIDETQMSLELAPHARGIEPGGSHGASASRRRGDRPARRARPTCRDAPCVVNNT